MGDLMVASAGGVCWKGSGFRQQWAACACAIAVRYPSFSFAFQAFEIGFLAFTCLDRNVIGFLISSSTWTSAILFVPAALFNMIFTIRPRSSETYANLEIGSSVPLIVLCAEHFSQPNSMRTGTAVWNHDASSVFCWLFFLFIQRIRIMATIAANNTRIFIVRFISKCFYLLLTNSLMVPLALRSSMYAFIYLPSASA